MAEVATILARFNQASACVALSTSTNDEIRYDVEFQSGISLCSSLHSDQAVDAQWQQTVGFNQASACVALSTAAN